MAAKTAILATAIANPVVSYVHRETQNAKEIASNAMTVEHCAKNANKETQSANKIASKCVSPSDASEVMTVSAVSRLRTRRLVADRNYVARKVDARRIRPTP